MAIKQLAIRFEGLEIKRHTSQPPVFDQNGNPFDLDDPEWPVVKDHVFQVKFWAMPKTLPYMLKYLEEHWEYFNRTRFGGRMKPPKLGIMPARDAMKLKNEGLYRPALDELLISANLFNAPHEGYLNSCLIHEMCHQWCAQILGDSEHKIKKGHGPKWEATMRMAGMPPDIHANAPRSIYMGRKDLKKYTPKENIRLKVDKILKGK